MDMLGHSFFFFSNATTGKAAVVYRRADGDVGTDRRGLSPRPAVPPHGRRLTTTGVNIRTAAASTSVRPERHADRHVHVAGEHRHLQTRHRTEVGVVADVGHGFQTVDELFGVFEQPLGRVRAAERATGLCGLSRHDGDRQRAGGRLLRRPSAGALSERVRQASLRSGRGCEDRSLQCGADLVGREQRARIDHVHRHRIDGGCGGRGALRRGRGDCTCARCARSICARSITVVAARDEGHRAREDTHRYRRRQAAPAVSDHGSDPIAP